MDVDVSPVEQRRFNAELSRTAAHIRRRRRNRFLHHVLEVAGRSHLALARHLHGFNSQYLAADRSPGEARHDADLVFAINLAMAEFRNAGIVGQILRGDFDGFRRTGFKVAHRLARKLGQLAFKVADARLARVMADQRRQAGIFQLPLAFLQPMVFHQLRQQMTAGDLNLLIFRVPRNADDLHPVEQRLRHVERVRRGDEHHVRKVIIDLQIVIREGGILLRVQHFKQRRGRIAAEILTHLVDFIEQKERVRFLRLLHRLDNLARHRADIGAAMPANLGLIPYAAQRHAHEFAARRLRNGFAQRGLADARRADQTQDRALELVHAFLHGEIFDNPLFDFFKPVMIGVENFLRLGEIVFHLGAIVPGDRGQPVEVVPDHC